MALCCCAWKEQGWVGGWWAPVAEYCRVVAAGCWLCGWVAGWLGWLAGWLVGGR